MKRLILILFVAIILLSSCSKMTEGIVIEKFHKDSYPYVTYIYVNNMVIPQIYIMPEHWYLTLLNHDTGEKGTIAVDSNTWMNVNVGDYYMK